MTGDEVSGPDSERITFWDESGGQTAADGTPVSWGASAGTDAPALALTPTQRRRDFIRTLAAAGMLGLAGCGSGNGSGNGSGGNGAGGPTTTAGGGSGNGGNGSGSNGSGSGGNGNGDGSPGSGEPMVLEEDAPFVLPAGTVDTTFDVDLTPETVMLEGDDLDAVLEVDVDTHRYVLDADRLAASGLSVSEGSILWLSGVDMRRVSSVSRSGDRVTVETEFAALNEAVSDGEVGWDADVGFDAGQVVTDLADGGEGGADGNNGGDGGDGTSGGGSSIRPLSAGQAALVDITMLDREGTERPIQQFSQSGPEIEWSFTQDNREYTFGLKPGNDEMELKAEVKGPASGPVGGNPNVRLTGVGRMKKAKSTGNATYSSGNLNAMDYEANNLAGELKIDVVSAGSGAYDFKWDFPGAMFKWVVFVGALPVTITVATALVARVHVPAKATAKAISRFSYDGKSGFRYDGTDVKADAQFAGFGFKPDSVDSSAYIGVAVDLQFGVMFPKMSVSIFGTFLVPYLSLEMYIGSKLTWGPVCKEGYVRMVSAVGYDLTVLGVSIKTDKTTLMDRQETTSGDSCRTN